MRAKIISSLEKCFPDENVTMKVPLEAFSLLSNERYSFQVCYDFQELMDSRKVVHFHIESPLADQITIYQVKCIPSRMPVYRKRYDDNYLRTQPGLFPDLLEPMPKNYRLFADNTLNALWLELEPGSETQPGTYSITCVFTDPEGNRLWEQTVSATVLAAALPDQTLIFTQWFYTDCLLQYYCTEAFDERHWQIIENFLRNAKRYGQNMILTPVLTPALDTYVGGQRPTTQLVEIFLAQGQYRFDFSRLGRWVEMCDRVGIEHLEINHFFSQWGAIACPKVMAHVDGEYRQIFGWDTPSDCDEYKAFLEALIPAMLDYLKQHNGADRRCYFHISDEPNKKHLDRYLKLSGMVRPLVEGYPIIDALTDYDFYATGAATCPIPSCNHLDPFLENQVPNLWTYYCCDQNLNVTNRYFAMPSARTRIIGVQMYKFRIAGFLHWGYNFYNNEHSYAPIDPFLCSDGEGFAPSGDTYSVYPGRNGQPWPSLRQPVFYDALQDLRALELCESIHGREFTMQLLEEGIEPITWTSYPKEAQWLLDLRQRLNRAITR